MKDAIQCQKVNNTEQSHQKPINLEKLVFEILSPGIGEYFYCCQHAAAVMSLKKVKDGRWTELYPLINSLGAINMETQYTGTKWCSFKSVDLSKLYPPSADWYPPIESDDLLLSTCSPSGDFYRAAAATLNCITNSLGLMQFPSTSGWWVTTYKLHLALYNYLQSICTYALVSLPSFLICRW